MSARSNWKRVLGDVMEQQGFADAVPSDRPNCPYAVFPGGATADRDGLEVTVKMMGAIAPA
ncbi:hypothetical protein [Leptolyngbya sp. CCY15150]|uniref:hypothetical protein n=1 Tax=Leptolyngbya sp. CCY15150 TaxID=2767772 RepID=UPI00194F7C01|nr:hypothetical protein [Leptolyngbya sp. CCY15150]